MTIERPLVNAPQAASRKRNRRYVLERAKKQLRRHYSWPQVAEGRNHEQTALKSRAPLAVVKEGSSHRIVSTVRRTDCRRPRFADGFVQSIDAINIATGCFRQLQRIGTALASGTTPAILTRHSRGSQARAGIDNPGIPGQSSGYAALKTACHANRESKKPTTIAIAIAVNSYRRRGAAGAAPR